MECGWDLLPVRVGVSLFFLFERGHFGSHGFGIWNQSSELPFATRFENGDVILSGSNLLVLLIKQIEFNLHAESLVIGIILNGAHGIDQAGALGFFQFNIADLQVAGGLLRFGNGLCARVCGRGWGRIGGCRRNFDWGRGWFDCPFVGKRILLPPLRPPTEDRK